MSPRLKWALVAMNKEWGIYRRSCADGSRHVPFQQQEDDLHRYWSVRSTILLSIENDDEELAIAQAEAYTKLLAGKTAPPLRAG